MIGIKKCCDIFISQNKNYKLSPLKINGLPYKAYEIKKESFFINETVVVVGYDTFINFQNIDKVSVLFSDMHKQKGISYIIVAVGDASLTAKDCLHFSKEKYTYVHYVLITENSVISNKEFNYSASAAVKRLIDIITDDLNASSAVKLLSSAKLMSERRAQRTDSPIDWAKTLSNLNGGNDGEDDGDDDDDDEFVKITS